MRPRSNKTIEMAMNEVSPTDRTWLFYHQVRTLHHQQLRCHRFSPEPSMAMEYSITSCSMGKSSTHGFFVGAFHWLAGSLQGICSVAGSNNQIDRKILIVIWSGYKCIKAHYVCRNACGKMLTRFYVSMVLCTRVQMEICFRNTCIYNFIYVYIMGLNADVQKNIHKFMCVCMHVYYIKLYV